MLETLALTAALLMGNTDDDSYPTAGRLDSYIFAQTQRVDVGGGATSVSAENNVPMPRHGYFPFRVFIDNSLGPRQTIRVGFYPTGQGNRTISKNVEVAAGERRTVVLPLPYISRYGAVRVRGPGITQRGDQTVYFNNVYAPQEAVLSLGSTDDFERWVGKPPAHTSGDVNVLSMPALEAPTELAAYSGYDTVIIPTDPFETLGEGQRRALEQYAATGGTLVLGHASRGLNATFPLLGGEPQRSQKYGLGRLIIDTEPKGALSAVVDSHPPVVNPRSAGAAYNNRPSRYNRPAVAEFIALLPQATAPIGKFLLIISLFTLAIGPGSIFVARRRGPAALLLTIPATAFITCSAIIGYSIAQDGFTVHASTRGITLLDSRQHRALSVGLTAYYANLAPGAAHFSQAVAVIAPAEGAGEQYAPSIDWGESAAVTGDFIPSRTYREWGFVSAEPTRARIVIKKQDGLWRVQNALGSRIVAITFMADDALWSVGDVRDGADRAAIPANGAVPRLEPAVVDRFSVAARERVERPLKEGEFLATIEGQGFVPAGGLRLSQDFSTGLVRGEVER